MLTDEELKALNEEIALLVGDMKFDKPIVIGRRAFHWKSHGTLFEAAPLYAEDMETAYLVVDYLRTKNFYFEMSDMPGECIVRVTASFTKGPLLQKREPDVLRVASTPALAIALAGKVVLATLKRIGT